jgi:hypothetical protein
LPGDAETLRRSATIGRELSALLDLDQSVTTITTGKIRTELQTIAVASREGGGSLNPDAGDLDVTVGWGHKGGEAVMPGKGKAIERDYTPKEREAIAAGASAFGLTEEQVVKLLGTRTLDVYLNHLAFWKNIPLRVWEYTIGGYQVIKKWLSYRERSIVERGLTMNEMRTVTDIARRIAAVILMEPALNANYEAVKKSAEVWPSIQSRKASSAKNSSGASKDASPRNRLP